MEQDTYLKFFDEFSKWRSQDTGVVLDYTVLIDASGSMLEKTAEDVDNLYRDAWAKEQMHDFQHECGRIPAPPRKIDLAKFAAWVLIDRVHEESRKDTCMVGSFGQLLDTCKKQTFKALIKKDVCGIRVPERAPTRLWASINDILKDISRTAASPLKLKHIVVFTDGWDNLSDKSNFDRINEDVSYRDQRNAELAQEYVLDFYKNMKKDGEENPPRLRIIAVDPSGELSSLWKGVQNVCNDTIYPFPVVQIEAHSSMDLVVRAFMEEAQRMKERLARVGTIENFVWIFLGKEAPKPRFFIYPGAVIATLCAMGKLTEPKIRLQELRQLIHNFIQGTCDEETFQPIGPHLIDSAQIDSKQYQDFLANPQTVEVLTEVVVECALKSGWLRMDGKDNCILEIEYPSPASILLKRFFLSGDWKDGRARLQNIMPEIRQMCNNNNLPFPLITVDEIRSRFDWKE